MLDPKHQQSASDLPAELARRVDALHERLATIDHYTLLGLQRGATRAQVRQAFLLLAPQFHPDKYFGKNLGPYAAKMQRVFAQLSVAHDTLVNDERRAEYTEGLPPPLPPSASPQEHARFGSTPPRLATPAAPHDSQASADATRARQQAFASRLAGHSSARMRSGTPVVPFAPGEAPRRNTSSLGMPAVDPQAAVDALKRRYEDTVAHARGKHSSGVAQAAEAAAAKEQQHAAAVARAKESEQKQDYADAGVSWARAFDLVPAADLAHRASLCLRRAGVDSRRAAKYGEEAVKMDPHKAPYRVNLALVYADLGLSLRARGEIERAQAIDPQNAQLKEAFVRIKAMK